jgi:hypothetical protein
MGSLPPTTASTLTPGQLASQNDAYEKTVLYDINYAYQQQSAKNNNNKLRFTLSVPTANNTTITFNAHIDPNHLIYSAEKRIVPLDVLTGVVVQDFGFNAETMELKGTTGSAYYKEIDTLQSIFRSQSMNGLPSKVSISIEGKTYKAAWKEFVFDRQNTAAGGNTINYTISFIILPTHTVLQGTSLGPTAAANAASNSQQYSTGAAVLQAVTTGGKSVYQYLKFSKDVPLTSLQQASNFVQQNYDPSANGGMAFPGINIPLQANQTINVPNDWSTVVADD